MPDIETIEYIKWLQDSIDQVKALQSDLIWHYLEFEWEELEYANDILNEWNEMIARFREAIQKSREE